MNSLKIVIVGVVVSAFLSGCGSSAPSEKNLETTVLNYSRASETKNWAGVCANISEQSKQGIIDNSGQLSCEAGLEALPAKGKKTLSDIAKGATFVSADINGDKAVAKVQTTGGIAEVPMVAENGTWKVHLYK